MKNWILVSVLSLSFASFCIAQKQSDEQKPIEDRCYDLSHLSEEGIQQFFENPDSSVLFCVQGTSLPLHFILKGDLVELESSDYPFLLKIKQSFYLRFQEDQVVLSLDKVIWKPVQEMLTGMISIGLNLQEEIPHLQVELEANIR